MVTAGERQEREAFGRAGESNRSLFSSLRGIMRLSALHPAFTAAVNERGVAAAWLVRQTQGTGKGANRQKAAIKLRLDGKV